jgi:xanthosine utilization system XapX-like protein
VQNIDPVLSVDASVAKPAAIALYGFPGTHRGEKMRKLVRALIYQKWFYAFLAVVLWFDCYTDVADVIEAFSPREVVSLIMSSTGAMLVTLIFVDLHLRWPPRSR